MNKIPMSKRIAATALSASLLLSCCLTTPLARALGDRETSGPSTRSSIVDGDLGSGSVQYLRDRDGVEAGGTYAIFYNTTRSILYHTGTGKTDQVTGTVANDALSLASNFASSRQLWTIEKREGDDGYNIKSLDSNRYLDLSQTTAVNGHVNTSDQPVRVDITFHEDTGSYSLSNGSNYLTHGSTAGNKYYCSTSQDTALTQFQLYLETEVAPTVVGENPKGTEAVDVPFSSEATGSQHFRIPALYTLDNGWIVAASDIRWTTGGDSPQNLDTIVSVSKDNGQTWEWEVVNYLADMADTSTGNASSSFIDPSIVQDSNGTIHMVVDACPSYVGLMSGNQMGQESTGFDSQGRLLVAKATAGTYAPKTASSYTYYVDLNNTNGLAEPANDNGKDVILYPICSQDGTVTDTWVDAFLNVYVKSEEDGTFTKPYVTQLGNSANRVQKNLFFQNSEWKVYPVFYIMHRTAQVTEDGLVWSAPQFLDIKAADNEKFTGVCPGRGITMTYNDTERIIFPLYDNRTGNELASVIYSDDGGATWQRGGHNSNLNGVGKTSESQVVLLPNGDLRMYSRNTINYVSYADSSDGGVTWSQCQPDNNLFSQKSGGGCMVSFINLEGTLIGPDDQEYENLILGSYARIQRTEGIVRIGSADENGTVTWLNEDVTRYDENNYFAYSCVSQLQENGKATDTFGILYENQGSPCQIKYETLTVQDLLGEGWYMVQDESEKITLTLEPQFVNLSVGQSGQVQAIVTPEDAATITWSSDTPAVATVSDTGVVTAVSSGTATITATATASNGIVRTAKLSVAVQGESGIFLPPCFQDIISSEDHEAQTTYNLDTDGLNAEGVYAIYHAGTQRILYHANGQSNTDQVTGSVSNNQLTLDGQYAASRQLWRITQTEEGYTIQSLEADGAYLRLNDSATQPGARVPVQSEPYTLHIQPGATPGSYTISHTVGDRELYLSHSSEATKQYYVSAEASEFQLFLETTIPAHTTYQVSVSGLRGLVSFVDTLDPQAYSASSWEALQAAKQAANDLLSSDDAPVFDNESDAQARLDQVTALTKDLYQAWMDLVPPQTSTDKALLQKTYDYALTLSTQGVTESAKKLFEDALAQAKAVLDDPDATAEEINTAWDDLLVGIWSLGLTQGDKAMLEQLITKAEAMVEDSDKYVADHWQALLDALETALAVQADGDAMQEDVDQAAQALLNAILDQRFKADKSILEGLIAQAQRIDLTGYTAQSVATFRTALAEAQAVLADHSLSEDEQSQVDAMVDKLTAAIHGLTADGAAEPSDTPATDTPEASKAPDATQKPAQDDKVPATGDTQVMGLWIALTAASAVALASLATARKKRS